MKVLSHRGLTTSAVENTLEAFRAAIDLGCQGIETDLRLAADGEIVLFHDRFVGRHRVSALTRPQLSELVGYHVPTLEEAIQTLPEDVFWVLEVKAQPVVDALKARESLLKERNVLVISFWHDTIQGLAEETSLPLGVLIRHAPWNFLSIVEDLNPRIKAVVWEHEFLSKKAVQLAREQGWVNFSYGPKGPDEHRECLELGLYGTITDEPEVALACLRGTLAA